MILKEYKELMNSMINPFVIPFVDPCEEGFISDEIFEKACHTVFSEPPIDVVFEETLPMAANEVAFSQEFLPGQFDQRADSAEQCVKLLNEKEDAVIRTAVTYVITGNINDDQFAQIKNYCINPVDSRETDDKSIPEIQE